MINKYSKVFFLLALGLYLIILCWILFFQIGNTDRESYFVNPDDHLLPFNSTYNMLKNAFTYRFTSHGQEFRNIFLVNILGNLVLLFPWGFLAPLVFKKLNGVLSVALSGFFISFSAEVIQFAFSLGVFDIDDLMFNTIGAVLGLYGLMFTKYFLWKIKTASINNLQDKQLKRDDI